MIIIVEYTLNQEFSIINIKFCNTPKNAVITAFALKSGVMLKQIVDF